LLLYQWYKVAAMSSCYTDECLILRFIEKRATIVLLDHRELWQSNSLWARVQR
jgi:hypothetical protein